jgi:outer membrane protein
MKKLGVRGWVLGVAALCAATPLNAQQKLTLQQSVDLAQKQGYDAASAVATRDAARAREHAFSMRRLPQLSLNATPAQFQKDIQPVIQADGSTLFKPVEQMTARGGVTLSQLFPLTGATFSVTSELQRYERTGTATPTLTYNTAPVTFAITQPVFRPNTQRWEARVENATLTAAESQYLEDREGVAITATEAFFDLYVARKQLDNAEQNVSRNDTLYTINKGRLEVGKIGENDLLQSELSLLRSRSQAENAQLEHQRSLAAYRLAVNLPSDANVEVVAPATIPAITADTVKAVEQAMKNSARIRGLELAAVTARRDVVEKGLSRFPGANVTARFGLTQTADELNMAYKDPLESQRFAIGIDIPLFSWGALGADAQQARANYRRVDATNKRSREQVRQAAHFAALQLTQAKRNLEVTAKADTVAQKRYEVAYNRYVIGRIGIDNLYIAQNEKDQAVSQYLAALRNYWVAYYRLRQTTLYDFERGAPIQ